MLGLVGQQTTTTHSRDRQQCWSQTLVLCSCCRYRQAWIWEDKTINYFSSIGRSSGKLKRPKCGTITDGLYEVYYVICGRLASINRGYVCQKPLSKLDKLRQSVSPSSARPTLPSLAKINVTKAGQNGGQWWPVSCPKEHVTHGFLACDAVTFCWAENYLTVSLRPESWALPTPQSCPALLAMTSLPPSFSCQAEKQHVPYSLVCDHRRDCLDGSDEVFCTFLPCQWNSEFQCLSKQVCYAVHHNVSLLAVSE